MPLGYYNKDGRGRKPGTGSVRYISSGPTKRQLRFSFSEDVIRQLGELNPEARVYGGTFNRLRLRFTRFPWHVPQVLLLQLTLMHDDNSYRVHKGRSNPRYWCEVAASRLEVKPGVMGFTFDDMVFDPSRKGLVVQFPIEALTDEAQERWTRLERWHQTKEAAAG